MVSVADWSSSAMCWQHTASCKKVVCSLQVMTMLSLEHKSINLGQGAKHRQTRGRILLRRSFPYSLSFCLHMLAHMHWPAAVKPATSDAQRHQKPLSCCLSLTQPLTLSADVGHRVSRCGGARQHEAGGGGGAPEAPQSIRPHGWAS